MNEWPVQKEEPVHCAPTIGVKSKVQPIKKWVKAAAAAAASLLKKRKKKKSLEMNTRTLHIH